MISVQKICTNLQHFDTYSSHNPVGVDDGATTDVGSDVD